MRCVLGTLLGVVCMTSSLDAKSVLLVSVSGEDRVAQFAIDETSGELTPIEGFTVNGAAGPMAISPDGRTLYVSLRSTHRVASYRIEPHTFTPLNEIDVGGSGTFLATDVSTATVATTTSSAQASTAMVTDVLPCMRLKRMGHWVIRSSQSAQRRTLTAS